MEHIDDTKDVLMQFLGQTYGELHKIDTMITGSSQHLQQRSSAFKNTVSDILTNQVGSVPNTPPHLTVSPAGPVRITPTNMAPAQVVPDNDPNQLEFVFDKEDVSSIYKTLARLEDKLDRVDKKLARLLESKKT